MTSQAARPAVALYRTLDRATLEQLYVGEGLSIKQVADRLGPPASKRVVQRALEAHGIPLREARPPARKQLLMSRELLERLYVDEGRNLDEVAAAVGVNVATVKKRMQALGIARRKGAWRRVGDRQPMTYDVLHELRVVQKLPAVEIARQLGYSEIQVRSALARHGIVTAPRRPPSLVSRLGRGELWWLHHHEQLTVVELARRLRTSTEAVAARLRELDLGVRASTRLVVPPTRPAGVPTPDLELVEATFAQAARRPPQGRSAPRPLDQADPAELRHLHHELKLGLTEIGQRYGATAGSVRSRLESLGIEVRHRRGTPRQRPPLRRWSPATRGPLRPGRGDRRPSPARHPPQGRRWGPRPAGGSHQGRPLGALCRPPASSGRRRRLCIKNDRWRVLEAAGAAPLAKEGPNQRRDSLDAILAAKKPPSPLPHRLVVFDSGVDHIGHNGGDAAAAHFDLLLATLVRAIRKLQQWGYHEVHVATDHGFVLSSAHALGQRIEADKQSFAYDGNRTAILRQEASTPLTTVPFDLDPSWKVAVLPGTRSFRNPGTFYHGGVTLQEVVVAHLVMRSEATPRSQPKLRVVIPAPEVATLTVRIELHPPLQAAQSLFEPEAPMLRVRVFLGEPSAPRSNERVVEIDPGQDTPVSATLFLQRDPPIRAGTEIPVQVVDLDTGESFAAGAKIRVIRDID